MSPNNVMPQLYRSSNKLLSQHQWRAMPVYLLLFFVVIGYLWSTYVSDAAAFVQSTPTTLIPYQGRVLDSSEQPLTGNYRLRVALYSTPTGGSALWSEVQTTVAFQQGLFHLLLGSSTPIPQTVITQNSLLYLGITIGDDSEMTPRVQLGSVPYAIQAQTVTDGAVTSEKIADGAITADKLAPTLQVGVPAGTIVMWSGALTAIPEGWALCDGTQGTPNLIDRFILSVDANQNPGETGGTHQQTLTVDNLPSHTHTFTTNSAGAHSHATHIEDDNGFGSGSKGGVDNTSGNGDVRTTEDGSHTHSGTTNSTGSGVAFDNRPQFYRLAFIMKL